jgi:hypothetical protein
MTTILTKKDIDDLEIYLKNLSDDDKYSQISSINEINIKNEELINHEKEIINNEKEVINRNQELINYNQELINYNQEFQKDKIINEEYSNYLEILINANNKIIKQTDNFIYKENIPEKNKINCKNKFKTEMINNILNGINNLESMLNNFKK